MKISSHLSVDVVAVDAADNVTCLVEVTAPTPDTVTERPGQALIVVLDRSGSMHGEPIETSKTSIIGLTRRLAPQDAFGLVVFDTAADVVAPVRRIADCDRDDLERSIARVESGGSTDLGGGYLLGLREAERAIANGLAATATVLLVSDGHANAGITDAVQLSGVAAGAYDRTRITTSTLGYGTGYDEHLLEALTRGGQGTHAFAPDPDVAGQAFSEVVTDLLDKSVIGAQMRIKPQLGLVNTVQVQGAMPNYADGDAVVVTLGDMYAGETRKVLFRLGVPAVPSLGLATVADCVFEYTAMPELLAHTVTFPIAVNVVPGDQAAGRIPNPIVEVEELLIAISDAKLSATNDLRSGDIDSARAKLGTSITSLNSKRKDLAEGPTPPPPGLTQRLDEAAAELLGLADSAMHEDTMMSSKRFMQSFSATSRNKPRRPQPSGSRPTPPARPARPGSGAAPRPSNPSPSGSADNNA